MQYTNESKRSFYSGAAYEHYAARRHKQHDPVLVRAPRRAQVFGLQQAQPSESIGWRRVRVYEEVVYTENEDEHEADNADRQ